MAEKNNTPEEGEEALLGLVTDLLNHWLHVMSLFDQAQIQMADHPSLAEALLPPSASLRAAHLALTKASAATEGPIRELLDGAEYSLRACDGISHHEEGFGPVMKAMRIHCRAQEACLPLSQFMSPVNRYFLDKTASENATILAEVEAKTGNPDRGLFSMDNNRNSRGGFSAFIPERLLPNPPLIIALHGGTGHGADFIWSWVRESRSRGFIVIAPTSSGDTWSMIDDNDTDLPVLLTLVEQIGSRFDVDIEHILLTGMSDGATYSLLAGLRENSPFTHLAPFSGVFHPDIMMSGNLQYASRKPVYLVHGTNDWMFPVDAAHMTNDTLVAAGADVTLRIIDGLSHTYARGENRALLEWFDPCLAT